MREYEVADEYKEGFNAEYKAAYEDYFYKNSANWDSMTDEQQLDVLKSAHTKGSNAAKAWYVKYGPKN